MIDAETKPLVSLVMLTFNQERFVLEAVQGALAQDYSPLEIIISDDASTDRTFSLVERALQGYSGPHKVTLRKNEANVGLARHFSSVIALTSGEIVVGAAGDDISLSDRVTRTESILAAHPEATFVSFSDICIDRHGAEISARRVHSPGIRKVTLDDYVSGRTPSLSGASRAYRRRIFDTFGSMNPACPTEDTPHILRGLILGPGLVSSEPGIRYRIHDENLSSAGSLARMPVAAIRDQYLADVATACSAGLLSGESARRLEAWIGETYMRRQVESRIHNARYPLAALLAATLGSGLGFRSRLLVAGRFLRRALGGR